MNLIWFDLVKGLVIFALGYYIGARLVTPWIQTGAPPKKFFPWAAVAVLVITLVYQPIMLKPAGAVQTRSGYDPDISSEPIPEIERQYRETYEAPDNSDQIDRITK